MTVAVLNNAGSKKQGVPRLPVVHDMSCRCMYMHMQLQVHVCVCCIRQKTCRHANECTT